MAKYRTTMIIMQQRKMLINERSTVRISLKKITYTWFIIVERWLEKK